MPPDLRAASSHLVFLGTEFTDLLEPHMLSLSMVTLDGYRFVTEAAKQLAAHRPRTPPQSNPQLRSSGRSKVAKPSPFRFCWRDVEPECWWGGSSDSGESVPPSRRV